MGRSGEYFIAPYMPAIKVGFTSTQATYPALNNRLSPMNPIFLPLKNLLADQRTLPTDP